jgi:hypothetical protein
MNNHLILVSGKTGTGKSMCLRNIRNQERWMYLNCENNKALPFKNKFKTFNILDPLHVFEAFEHMAANSDNYDGIIIDTATYLMDMYETAYVLTAPDSRSAWGDYAQFWKRLMQQHIAKTNKKVAILAHTADVFNEGEMVTETLVKVKGSLMNQGIESYFSNVISTKTVPLSKLQKLNQESDHLVITDDEEIEELKHCFQTKKTKETANERMRSPLGMWKRNETFIDNDLQIVFDRLEQYYSED